MSSEDQPQVNPTPIQSPNPTPPPESEAHRDPDPAEPSDEAAIAADKTGPSDTVVATLKRPREEDAAEGDEVKASSDAPVAKRRVKATHDLIYRIVVPSRQIGKVIGRSGLRIQKIREDTKATIKIADAISFFFDR